MECTRSVARRITDFSQDEREPVSEEKASGSFGNSAVNAMQMLKNEMACEAEKAGLYSETEINAMVKEIRDEGE